MKFTQPRKHISILQKAQMRYKRNDSLKIMVTGNRNRNGGERVTDPRGKSEPGLRASNGQAND